MTDNTIIVNTDTSTAVSTFSGEVLFRVRLTQENIEQFVLAVKSGLIYDGSVADLMDRLSLIENRILERHEKGQDFSRLEVEEDILHNALITLQTYE